MADSRQTATSSTAAAAAAAAVLAPPLKGLSLLSRDSRQYDYAERKHTRKRSSLVLRKLPVSMLLQPNEDEDSIGNSSLDDFQRGDQTNKGQSEEINKDSFMHKTCLNSKFSLRTQMMLSFGLVGCCTILVVMLVSLVTAIVAGERMSDITQKSFSKLAKNVAGKTAHYLAEGLTPRILPYDLVQLLVEATNDRFQGYPQYEDDSRVPFFDTETQSNFYPLQGKPLPLDWEWPDGEGNVNDTNFYEHVQDRWPWYTDNSGRFDTSNAVFYMQGMCDPSETDPTSSRYMPNCTTANNDITTGGVYAPSPTNQQIHRKASDLTPLLKSLFEYHQDIKQIGLYFGNSGAGATVVFPRKELNSSQSYQSYGCTWMLDTHPLDPTRTFATLADFERCDQDGRRRSSADPIPARLYNPMDRHWCARQALQPNKIHHEGPFENAWKQGQWLMTLGRAVYDRITNEFIACAMIDFLVDAVEELLKESKVSPESEVSVIRFNAEGTILASTAWDTEVKTSNIVSVDKINVGVTREIYQQFYELVDYYSDVPWDPTNLTVIYEETLLHGDGYLLAAHPIPPVPSRYQRDYLPEFLVVVSVLEDEFFSTANELEASIKENVYDLERVIVIVGCAGLLLMLAVIFMFANTLTSPLEYMSRIADDIMLNYFGDAAEHSMIVLQKHKHLLPLKCIPETELQDIESQFIKMVKSFSGANMAKDAQKEETEIENNFNMIDEFQMLYESRKMDNAFKYNFPERTFKSEKRIVRKEMPFHRLNLGCNLNKDAHTASASSVYRRRDRDKDMKSPLFFWILILIVVPLMATTISISCILMLNVANSFPVFVDTAKERFVKEEIIALSKFVGLKANLTASTTERAARDLHVLSRYTNWILFGGLNSTSDSTRFTTGIEACKLYDDLNDCPYVQKTTCDCDWNVKNWSCYSNSEETRYLRQQSFFACQSQDVDSNGDRLTTSFPDVAYSAATTAWWENTTEIPGYEIRNQPSSRNATSFARLQSASAIPVIQVLYNYDSFQDAFIAGVAIGFEADGMFFGYNGCSPPGDPILATWSSTIENGASQLRPELCPLGKYGYDPRCRGWYHEGKEAKGGVNKSGLYATPPYIFATTQLFAQSASSPIYHPKTGEHIGATLIDFVSEPILASLEEENFPLSGRGFPVLITIESDNLGADTVIGPGLEEGIPTPITLLVLPNDRVCDGANCDEGFHAIVGEMKAGKRDSAKFTRLADDGSEETLYISYAPVVLNSLSPVDSNDFGRGVNKADYLLYSLAVAQYEEAMLSDFVETEEEIDTQSYIALAVLCATIIISTVSVLYISRAITISITEPMLHLLDLIVTINGLNDGEDHAEPVFGQRYGSKEVLKVTFTMEKLYKVIRSANASFFAGDVETAYQVLRDALRLFKRLGNEKAIGVACNNLGNCLLAAYRTLKATKEERICGFEKSEIIAKGTACFHEAIQQGEAAYDDFYAREGWSPNCLDFMQHLSNRYFNRAMFLLSVKDDHADPEKVKELGMRDLQISRDMDVEINDEGTQAGWHVRSPVKIFDAMLSRFRGYILLLQMGYPDEFELEECMGEAYQLITTELKKEDESELFAEIRAAGRMQQIESALMQYYAVMNDVTTAAKIAIRMLVEDEYTLSTAQLEAVKIIRQYIREDQDALEGCNFHEGITEALAVYQDRVECAIEEMQVHQINQVDELSTSTRMSLRDIGTTSEYSAVSELTEKRRISLRQSGHGDVIMEMF